MQIKMRDLKLWNFDREAYEPSSSKFNRRTKRAIAVYGAYLMIVETFVIIRCRVEKELLQINHQIP